MPELPEVETTRRGITPHVSGATVRRIEIRQPRLRWPVSAEISALGGHQLLAVGRRAKYILLHFAHGTVLVHLGMSGSLRICTPETVWRTHDHLALEMSHSLQLRYHDPRRFGCWLWAGPNWDSHFLIKDLGPEPLEDGFHADYLWSQCRQRRTAIKSFIMNGKVVVGVGNIYACEALFMCGVHPARAACTLKKREVSLLVDSIRMVLNRSIEQGGTTLRDFLREDNQPGYFKQQLQVYDRKGEACHRCGHIIEAITQNNRSTFFCPQCQR
ncbi:MAG: bifunctional DNA-formamidopyrimidine glycosylase/DNA-(apurinic or apyrimidinic site) lyase [Verrucomicrobia bacterium]|nr:bifunctional DNA-formamidopyrimidine glycosylase/DNA-(apurinic or apyrimidinic site) lyase [Verrucomicrobiota bacterium]